MKKYLFIILLVGVGFGKSNNDFEKAKLMHDSGQYDESKLILTNLISESTDSHIITQSLFELGRVLITTKEYKNAYKIFKRLIERDPNFKPNVLIIFPEFEVQDQSSSLIGYNIHPNPKQSSFEANVYVMDFGIKFILQYGLKLEYFTKNADGFIIGHETIYIQERELFDLYSKLKDIVIKSSGDFKLGANQSFREFNFPSGLTITISSSKTPKAYTDVSISKRGSRFSIKNMGEFTQVVNAAVKKVNELKSK